jgi:flagellar motor component MotA
MTRFLLGTLAVLATLGGAIWMEGGPLLGLLQASPFLITFFVPSFAVLAIWNLKTWGQAFRDAFAPASDAKSREVSGKLWDFYEKTCYAAGFLGIVAGAIIILRTPNTTARTMAESFSYALISPLYAVFFAIVARILRFRIVAGR